MMKPFFLLSLPLIAALATASSTSPLTYSSEQQPLLSSSSQSPSTVPAFPLAQPGDNQTCHLDLSAELFGGVSDACGRGVLDRGRCCPVLAAWLFAAHARSALQIRSPPLSPDADDLPMMPDDSQKCVDSLQSSLASRDIRLPRPNSTCDAVLCFCGIRLHQIGSLSCPAAFNVTAGNRTATPTAAVTDLERNCRNSSYAGCTRCLDSLQKILCRHTNMEEEVYNQLVEKAKEVGYDVKKLRKTPQLDPPPEEDDGPKDTKGIWWLKSLLGK